MAEYELKQELAELEGSLIAVEGVLKPADIRSEIEAL
jgi:hypothetical protein